MTNIFASKLLDKINDRFSVDSLNMPISEWIERNTTLRKRPFSFKGYEFQREIADDMHDDLNVIKISQVGLTEIQIRKALAILTRNRGTSLIFSLPNEVMYERISKGRIKPIIAADKVFNNPEDLANKAVRSTELFQFGQSFLYVVPAIESAATSISADFVFNDEVDLSDQKMISLFASRLQASKHRVTQRFSTPSYPLYGIDLNWQASDQKMYMCKCTRCNHWNHPEFDRKFIHIDGLPEVKSLTDVTIDYEAVLDLDNAYIKCEKCEAPLDLDDISKRQWVKKFSDRKSVRGYKITPFVSSNLNLKYIFKSLWTFQKDEYIRGFYNTVLGEPYSDGSIQIPLQDIQASMSLPSIIPDLASFNSTGLYVGIDVGQICHVVIGTGGSEESIDAVAFFQIKADDIVTFCKELCEKYNVVAGAIDRHPYEPTAKEIFRVTQGKIVPCEYRGMKDINLVTDEFGELTHSQAYPTSFLDNVATRIRKRTMKMGGYGQYKKVIEEHLRDMVREETPGEPAKWRKLHGNDHFFHALGFMLISPRLRSAAIHRFSVATTVSSAMKFVNVGTKDDNMVGFSKKRLDTLQVFR